MILLDDMQYLWHPVDCLKALVTVEGLERGGRGCCRAELESGSGAGFSFTPTRSCCIIKAECLHRRRRRKLFLRLIQALDGPD